MKKPRRMKKLFIEELEARKSTSPLFIHTMAGAEAGVGGKASPGGASKKDLVLRQKAKEEMVADKNATIQPIVNPGCIAMYAVKEPIAKVPIVGPIDPNKPIAMYAVKEPVEKVPIVGPIDPNKPICMYAPPNPKQPPVISNFGSEGGPVPTPMKYAPPDPTPGPKPTDGLGEGGFIIKAKSIRKRMPPPKSTDMANEAGPASKTNPITTLLSGEEGKGVKPRP